MPKREHSQTGQNRMERIGDLLQNTLAGILQQEIETPLVMLTVTKVTVSKDMSCANVYVSVFPDEKQKEAIANLNAKTKSIRHMLAHAEKQLRVTPMLRFYFDDSISRGSRIEELLNS